MEKSKKDKIITLKNGEKYVIVEQCVYEMKPYYYAAKLRDNQSIEEFKILSIYVDEKTNKEKVKIITDDNIVKNVCKFIDSYM